MEISKLEVDGKVVLGVRGRIDATTAELFKQALLGTVGDQPVRLVIDFAEVQFISSIGLRMLVVVAKRVVAVRGKLLFCGMNGPVRQVFDLAGFASVAPLLPSREAALASLG
jgi:anti-anti-sigma factor